MMVSMDRAGRVVIPQEVRTRLALTPDTELQIDVEGDVIRLVPVRSRARGVTEVDGLLVIERAGPQTVTDLDVQQWRDADQR